MPRAILIALVCAWRMLGGDHTAMHAYHTGTLQLQCGACHIASAPGSVVLNRPGHDQCIRCHPSAFRAGRALNAKEQNVCAQCHGDKGADLSRAEFSHQRHVDGLTRRDPMTGFRADCVFCHKSQASVPGHSECAACHTKAGMHPRFPDCSGCHHPEQVSAPMARYPDIRFSHADHRVDCPTCHQPAASLPKMLECATCHDAARAMAPHFRIANCSSCHLEQTSGPAPSSHNRNVRPPSHDEAFRLNHSGQAAAPDAKCYACHLNVSAAEKCEGCHQVMRPVSHTARWKDDVHGKFAALDRTTCATCHTADSCVRCHNQLPRSHAPLALFKNGGHATLALTNERACFTCHTFQDTCASCHKQVLR